MEIKQVKDIDRTRQHKILEWSFTGGDRTTYIEIDIVYERDDDSTMLLYALMNGNGVGFQGMEIMRVKEVFLLQFEEFAEMVLDDMPDSDEDEFDLAVKTMLTEFNKAIDAIMSQKVNDGSVIVTLPPMIEQVEFTIRSYYKHCGEEWDADWDSACDDECPVCRKAISPYRHEDIRDFIGWQPTGEEFPVAGLQSFEVYENLEHGKDNHPEIKKWIPIYEDDIEAVIIIPYDGENKK